MEITPILIQWYETNKRDLPWRKTHDPYKIWLSEVILQQTRVDQGMNYYYRFTERFPTVFDLSNASEQEVLKLWQGLGYYSRARNLHYTAKIIVNTLNGRFPDTFEGLKQLKGIGPYTAAAIASICFDRVCPVLDGNVARVISRLFNMSDPVNEPVGKNKIENILSTLIDTSDPGTFNQAIMEFGALQCTPRNPSCEDCPLSSICEAYAKGLVATLPIKSRKAKVIKRFFNYILIELKLKGRSHIYLNKRTGNDIWQGLYDFPMIESETSLSPEVLLQTEGWNKIFDGLEPEIISVSETYKHQLTHRQINARFYELEIQQELLNSNDKFLLINENEIHNYPLPRLIDKYLEERSA